MGTERGAPVFTTRGQFQTSVADDAKIHEGIPDLSFMRCCRVYQLYQGKEMIRRFSITKAISMAVVAIVLTSGSLVAQEKEAFTPERFAELQEQGALILIDVFADWCPTCAQQQKILADFQVEHADVPLHILEVNFDDQKEYVTEFRAPRQSTLILYRGEEQIWFSVAETRPDVIVAELTKGATAASDR